MNQRADSWKENFLAIATNPLINQRGWLLSHTMRRNTGEHRVKNVPMESLGVFRALTLDPLALDPSEHARNGFLQHRHILREQNESERQHPEPQDRQKAEKPADDQQKGQWDPDQPRRRLAQPTDKSGRARRKFAFKPGKMPVNLGFGIFAQWISPRLYRRC